MIDLRLGDCRELLKTIPDASVDAVITDPPYHKEYLHLYGSIASEAKRILKPGGLVMTLCGHHSIDRIIGDMRAYLDFYWVGGMPNKLGLVGRYHPRQMMCGWKPCLWFSKGKVPKHPYAFDFLDIKADKAHHIWGQPAAWFEYYVEKMTHPGSTVLDPVMGAGTTGIACVNQGRNFIGFEIDPGHFAVASERIAASQAAAQSKVA